MEESGIFSSVILDSSADNSLSSDSEKPLESADGPALFHDIILKVSNYLDVKTIKSARLVNATWNKALETRFKTKMMLQVGFSYEMSIQEFVKFFSPDTTNSNSKLIASSIWIKKSKYLQHPLMANWLEMYGDQLTTVKLGNSISKTEDNLKYRKNFFFPESMASILTRYCPNLKVFKILTPFFSELLPISDNKPISNEVKVDLDYLEIGDQNNQNYKIYFTSSSLLTILKCIKSVRSVKMSDVRRINLLRVNGSPEDERLGDNHATDVFDKIEELTLTSGNVDPRRFSSVEGSDLRFPNLQKLRLGYFCDWEDAGFPMEYLPDLLTSVKDHLKELVFYKSYYYPKIEDCILFPMPKLETFEISEIMAWDEPSLDFLEKLPALKQLKITLDDYCKTEKLKLQTVDQIFNVNKSTKRIVHLNLEGLTFRCFTKSSKQLENIRFCCPNLKNLEVDFRGTPVFAAFANFKNLRELRIHLFEPFESLDSDDFEGLSGAGIKKLCLERDDHLKSELPIKCSSIVDGCFTSLSLQTLELKGMKISKKEYELAMEKLKSAKLQLCLINCKIHDD